MLATITEAKLFKFRSFLYHLMKQLRSRQKKNLNAYSKRITSIPAHFNECGFQTSER